MEIKSIKENKVSSILQFSIPSIIAMLLSTVITITDGYFTGNYVGEEAIAAINLGLPVLYFYLGLGLCVGVGGSVISGQLIGAENRKKSSEIFSQSVITSIIICVIISVLVFLLFNPILHVLRAEGIVGEYFKEYYFIMLFDYPLLVLGTVLGMFIRIDGKPQFCMAVSIISCILNIILDYIFVAKLSMGVEGSAIGSLIVEAFVVLASICYFLTMSEKLKLKAFTFDADANKQIMFNGASEFIGEMASAIAMFAFNYVLMKYVGTSGVAAFSILGFAVYGYSMITIGFGQGLTPLVSVCIGAREYQLAEDLRRIVIRILFVIGVMVGLIFFIFGRAYAGGFGCDDNVVDMVATGFKIYAVTFVIMGYDVINSMYFTSCGDAKSSAIISMLRGIVLLLIFIAIFPAIWGMIGVWLVSPVSEAITSVVSYCLYKRSISSEVILYGD